jgi:tetratricopeptide (TPR) repeat protein
MGRASKLRSNDQPADAVRALNDARDAEPDNAEVLAKLGELLMRMNRPAEALTCLERLCQVRPGDTTPANDRSVALMALGRHHEAVFGFDVILQAEPRFVPAHYNKGVALGTLGRHAEALASYDNVLELDPKHVLALNNRGVALQSLGRLLDAIRSFAHAAVLDANCLPAHCNLANALRQLGRFEEALACCERALAIDPDNVVALNERGVARGKLGPLELAVEDFRRAIALDPNYVEAHENLFVVLTELGRNDEALGSIEAAIRLAPGRVRPYYNLTETRTMQPGDPRIAAMELIAGRMDELGQIPQIELCFSLGKTYADIQDYDRSFPWLARGCKLKRAAIDYNEAVTLDMMGRAAAAFDAETLNRRSGAGAPSRSPVFILGMPRSGTTLVEQILASHPQVFAAGEIEAFLMAMVDCAARLKSPDIPEAFADLSDEALKALGEDYLARTRPRAPEAARIVDKSLQSFRFAGLIHLALPGARFIHVVRDPLDTCLSCFTKLFVSELPYSYDLGELGRYYRGYARLMKHWAEALPAGVMIEVRYEDVVADLETQAKRIVAHAGLDWDPACLDFHTTQRPVRTASLMQVRQPIYSSAVGRWQAYEKHLGPLQESLGLA